MSAHSSTQDGSLSVGIIGNRVTEQDVRNYLTELGFHGNSAKFDELELVAIEPPGWLQIFRFTVHVSRDEQRRECFHGLVRDDERHGLQVRLYSDETERAEQQAVWSEGLIDGIRKPLPAPVFVLVACGVGIIGLAAVIGVWSRIVGTQ